MAEMIKHGLVWQDNNEFWHYGSYLHGNSAKIKSKFNNIDFSVVVVYALSQLGHITHDKNEDINFYKKEGTTLKTITPEHSKKWDNRRPEVV